jgi:hypothetical protein
MGIFRFDCGIERFGTRFVEPPADGDHVREFRFAGYLFAAALRM